MSGKRGPKYEEEMELRRGPWTLEEDSLLIHYIACHGEGRWNLLARCSGLKRTGKSCRLRWLNYLKPDVKRGNLSPEEQYLILELHSKWGNRWSRIAQYLPGRTDNEIKNYWRTRVQKQARQLKIDANSTIFRDAVRCFWMPRLLEKMGSSSSLPSSNLNTATTTITTTTTTTTTTTNTASNNNVTATFNQASHAPRPEMFDPSMQAAFDNASYYELSGSEDCSPTASSGSTALTQLPKISEFSSNPSGDLADISFNQLLSGHTINSNAYDIDPFDLGPASASATDWTISENNCISNAAADSFLWGLDELWHVRKLHEWGGI